MTRHVILTFEEIFPGEKIKKNKIIRRISPENFLRLIGGGMLIKTKTEKIIKSIKTIKPVFVEFLWFFSTPEQAWSREFVLKKYDLFHYDHKIFSNYSLLSLFYSYKNATSENEDITTTEERDFLKLVLLENRQFVQMQGFSPKKEEVFSGLAFLPMVWPLMDTDQINPSEMIVCGMIKFDLFLKWITKEYQNLVHEFENASGLSLKAIGGTLFPMLFELHKKELFFEILNTGNNPHLDKLCEMISSDALISGDEKDFTSIKTFPILKISDKKYALAFLPFLVGYVTLGLYFRFRSIYLKVYGKDNFRTLYTKKFSEETYTLTTLKYAFGPNYQIISVDDLPIKASKKCDYILLNESEIILIEVKDNLISSKDSGAFQMYQIKAVIEKLLCGDKGVVQLQDTVLYLKQHPEIIGLSSLAGMNVYPVILTCNNKFNASTVNLIVNEMNMQNTQIYPSVEVRPITIIFADTLLFHADHLYLGKVDFTKLLDWYHLNTTYLTREMCSNDDEYVSSRVEPFYTFFNSMLDKLDLRQPTRHFVKHGMTLSQN